MSRPKPRPGVRIDEAVIEFVEQRRQALGHAAPRVGVFLCDCADAGALRAVLERIPEPVRPWLEQVVVMQERPGPAESATLPTLAAAEGSPDLLFHRTPRRAGYGGVRKAAFEYALRVGLDLVVVMRGDGSHPPEALPALLQPLFSDPRQIVVASRQMRVLGPAAGGTTRARMLAHVTTTAFQNRLLGLRFSDYHSGYRVYVRDALERVPFQLDADDRLFDIQILIQLRALGIPLLEVPLPPTWQEYPTGRVGLRQVLRACAAAVDYRMHQLHVTRRGRYLVDAGIHYTLKRNPSSSHMQIVAAIEPARRALDLGCSQGLLAGPLREKGVRLVGVDAGPGRQLAPELEDYFERDLEQPLELPTGRVFDYVVVSDVIEHIRSRAELLRSVRRYLKPGGRLIISTGNVALWFYRLSLLAGRFEYGPRGILDETHVHLYTRATFRREVEHAGFHVLSERVTPLPFEVVFDSTGRSRLVRAVTRLYYGMARAWPEMFAYQIILEAEITTLDEEATEPARA